MPKVTITSELGQPYRHTLQARSHTIVSDVDTTLKGGDTGPSPHELALMALGACAAMTIEMYAVRKKMDVTKVTVTVTEGTIDDPDHVVDPQSSSPAPKIPHIVEDIVIEGNLTDAELAKLKDIGEKCPVLKLFTGKKLVESQVTRAS